QERVQRARGMAGFLDVLEARTAERELAQGTVHLEELEQRDAAAVAGALTPPASAGAPKALAGERARIEPERRDLARRGDVLFAALAAQPAHEPLPDDRLDRRRYGERLHTDVG